MSLFRINVIVLSSSLPSSIRKSFSIENLLKRTSETQSDAFFNNFEQLSSKSIILGGNVSNAKLLSIIKKIESDYRLMNSGKLWRLRDDIYDEEWWVTENELNSSISTQSLQITTRDFKIDADESIIHFKTS